jgi:hypothetical protein
LAVLLRGVALAVLLRGVSLAVLLRGVALTVLLRGIAHVVTAQSEHMFCDRVGVRKAAKLGSRIHLVTDPRVRQTGN